MTRKGNTKNLLRPEDLTSEQLRERARKGGKASVEKKRRIKSMRELAQIMLNTALNDTEKKLLREGGGTIKELGGVPTKKAFLFARAMQRAGITGNVADMKGILEVAGEYNPEPTMVVPTTERKVLVINAPPGAKLSQEDVTAHTAVVKKSAKSVKKIKKSVKKKTSKKGKLLG